jgi:hypothetical protein
MVQSGLEVSRGRVRPRSWSCPWVGVVPLAPKAARKAHGNVTLAIVLMLALSLVAAFTASPAASTLLSYWRFRVSVEVTPGSVLLQLVVL